MKFKNKRVLRSNSHIVAIKLRVLAEIEAQKSQGSNGRPTSYNLQAYVCGLECCGTNKNIWKSINSHISHDFVQIGLKKWEQSPKSMVTRRTQLWLKHLGRNREAINKLVDNGRGQRCIVAA